MLALNPSARQVCRKRDALTLPLVLLLRFLDSLITLHSFASRFDVIVLSFSQKVHLGVIAHLEELDLGQGFTHQVPLFQHRFPQQQATAEVGAEAAAESYTLKIREELEVAPEATSMQSSRDPTPLINSKSVWVEKEATQVGHRRLMEELRITRMAEEEMEALVL